MTVRALQKLTQKLIEQGHGHRRVAVDKATFQHPLEDEGCTVLNVTAADIQVIPEADGDGGTATDSRGCEKCNLLLVMTGHN